MDIIYSDCVESYLGICGIWPGPLWRDKSGVFTSLSVSSSISLLLFSEMFKIDFYWDLLF